MKIVQVNAVYKKSSTGRTCEELERELQKVGHEVITACGSKTQESKSVIRIGNDLDVKIHGILSRITGHQGYFSVMATKKFLRFLKAYKPDVVHLRNLHGNYINLPMLLKFLAKNDIATVITLHDCFFYTGKCTNYLKEKCDRWKTGCHNCPRKKLDNPSWFFDFSKRLWKQKKGYFEQIKRLAVVGVSEWTKEHAKESILKSAPIIKRVYNWIDLDLFKPHDVSELRKDMDLEDKFIIFCIAQKWTEEKGISVIKSIADNMPENWRIIMVGSVPQNISLDKKVIRMGVVSDTKTLSDYYTLADVFVTPSIQETFGKTTAEAISSGTPVVAFRSLAIPELIGDDGKCGYILDENNPKLYIDKIKSIESVGKKEFEVNCRARAEEYFDCKTNVREYEEIYKSLLKM